MKFILIILSGVLVFKPVNGQPASQNAVQDILNKLPLLPSNQITSGQFSSHSEHQHNADFGNFLYEDNNGDAVIFDVKEPGCITNMWGTVLDSASVLKFYFDGEKKPRYAINAIAFYKGEHQRFPAPLVSYDRRGYYVADAYAGNSFAPVYFDHSLKITVEGKPTFYHILYKKLPYGTVWKDSLKNMQLNYLTQVLSNAGKPLPLTMLHQNERVYTQQLSLDPFASAELLNNTGQGAVQYLSIEADTSSSFLENVYIQMIWDNESAEKSSTNRLAYESSGNNRLYNVMCPAGMFFCSPYKAASVYSLPIEVQLIPGGRMKMICRFPMPFWKNARIVLLNKSGVSFNDIHTSVIINQTPYPQSQTGYFTTFFHKGLTNYGRDWLFCNANGTGYFLGVVQSCRLEHYCEGNEHFYMDGNATPQINGTGTEDYYLGCFWPNRRYNSPFAGCVNDVRLQSGGDPDAYLKIFKEDYLVPAVYYRFHLEMPIPFYSSMNAFIQHGAESSIESEYASLAYLYIKNQPALHEVDFIDVGNPANLKMHAYQSAGSLKKITSAYEGNYLYTNITDIGFYHHNDEISFTISVPKENKGIRLRRRTDQAAGPQAATVYVNGKLAGTWNNPQTNKILRWFDSEFDIPKALTQNASTLQVRLIVKGKSFNDFEYKVLAYD